LTERYVREWALAQAANGFVDYNATSRKFSLSPEQAMVFAEKDSPVYLAGAFDLVAAMIEGEQKVEHSFRTGGLGRFGRVPVLRDWYVLPTGLCEQHCTELAASP
jgi:hypothetical protein